MSSASHDIPARPLSERIREARLAARLSPEGLAFKAGVSLKTVERIETGVTVPRRATLRVILDVLELDPADFDIWNGEAA